MTSDDPRREHEAPQESQQLLPEVPRPSGDEPAPRDLVDRPDKSTDAGARDAVAPNSEPPGKVELVAAAPSDIADSPANGETSSGAGNDEPSRVPHDAAHTPNDASAESDDVQGTFAAPDRTSQNDVGSTDGVPPSQIANTTVPTSEPDDGVNSDVEDANEVEVSAPSADDGASEPGAEVFDAGAETPESPLPEVSTRSSAEASPSENDASPSAQSDDSPTSSASPRQAQEPVAAPAGGSHDGELPSRTTDMLSPGPDGQPPMARPIVLVRLADDVTHRMINDALAKLAADSSALMESIAADHVDYIFWQIRAQERAILRFD